MTSVENAVSVVPINGQGQVSLPPDFLRAYSLTEDSLLAMIRVGDALVIVPQDRALAEATAPIQEAWLQSGLSHADLPEILQRIRAEVVQEQFGDLSSDES